MQEVRAVIRNARMSAQKARLVADLVRGKPVEQALQTLDFTPKKAAGLIMKALRSAIANAEHNEGLDIDELSISRIFVDEAAKLKRFSPRAKGRSNRIIKHGCHITVAVAEKKAIEDSKKKITDKKKGTNVKKNTEKKAEMKASKKTTGSNSAEAGKKKTAAKSKKETKE